MIALRIILLIEMFSFLHKRSVNSKHRPITWSTVSACLILTDTKAKKELVLIKL